MYNTIMSSLKRFSSFAFFYMMVRGFLVGFSCLVLPMTVTLAQSSSSSAKTKESKGSKPAVVVELFTSQGCSSCPKADRVFEKLTKRPDVIALGYHVDYWDYLGWKDTMASANNTKRQRDYARFRGDRNVFTPQVIVGGKVSLVGGNEKAIWSEIKKQSHNSKALVNVKLWEDEKSLFIDIGAIPKSDGLGSKKTLAKKEEGTIWLAMIKRVQKVKITRGENRGEVLTYHNIVDELSPIGRWMGDKMSLRLPRKQWMERGSDGCVVILQQDGGKGTIRGAAQLISW